MSKVAIQRVTGGGEVLMNEVFDDIQDFDTQSWTNEDVAIVLDGLYRHGYHVEKFYSLDGKVMFEAISYTLID